MAKMESFLDRVRVGGVAVFAAGLALIAGALCWWQLEHYEDGLVDIFAKQQDQYVQLAVDQIGAAANDDAVTGVLDSIAGSNSQYWTLARDGEFVFVKDVADSNRYRGLPDATFFDTDEARSFIDGLSGRGVEHAQIVVDGHSYIASASSFMRDGASYCLCLLTGTEVVFDQNAYLAARVNLGTTVAVVLCVFVILSIAMALRNDRGNKRLAKARSEAADLRSKVALLSDQLLGRAPLVIAGDPSPASGDDRVVDEASEASAGPVAAPDTISKEDLMGSGAKRIYRFKFYLNSSHYVFFDGRQGDTHPHTWEFVLKILIDGSDLKLFSDYEKAIEVVFEPYQNKTLNELPPFDTVVPTLENIVEVFGQRLTGVVEGLNGKLLEFEGSETPTRSYLVSYE